jgi:hypothetical protein
MPVETVRELRLRLNSEDALSGWTVQEICGYTVLILLEKPVSLGVSDRCILLGFLVTGAWLIPRTGGVNG